MWIARSVNDGYYPGLAVLDRAYTAQAERAWIERVKPVFNTVHGTNDLFEGKGLPSWYRENWRSDKPWRREVKRSHS